MKDQFKAVKTPDSFTIISNDLLSLPSKDATDDLAIRLILLRKSLPPDLYTSFRKFVTQKIEISEYRYLKAMKRIEEWGFLERRYTGDSNWVHVWDEERGLRTLGLLGESKSQRTRVLPGSKSLKTRVGKSLKTRVGKSLKTRETCIYKETSIQDESLPQEKHPLDQDLRGQMDDYSVRSSIPDSPANRLSRRLG